MTHRTYNHRESGQSLVMFTLLLPVLIILVALVTDVGMLTIERRRIQNAADASALAGARMLPGDPDSAVADAEAYAGLNNVEDQEIVSIDVTETHVKDDTIEVRITRDVGFGFANIFGIAGASVTVRATATTGGIVGVSALAPFGVEQSVFEGLGQGDTTSLKYNATSSENGNFLPLVLDAPGSDEYGENIEFGSQGFLCSTGFETLICPSLVSTQPGNVIGKTREALEWIFENTSAACDTYDEVFQADPNNSTRLVMTPECNRFSNPTAQSYQLIIVPVISNLCNGSCDVTVLEFALFFIESYSCGGGGEGNSCDLIGRYARAAGSVEGIVGAYDPDGSVKSVRLIK